MNIDLPAPDADALALSEQLMAMITSRIREQGAISLTDYWDSCLYTPGLGYYAAGSAKFGAEGDFVTAPELGTQFSHCLADWFAGCDAQDTILELGAGTGALAADLLCRLEVLGCLPRRYLILDRSADLIERQRSTLAARCPGLLDRVSWINQAPRESWSGVIIGNEVVDAIAAERVIRHQDAWQSLRIDLRDGELCWSAADCERVDEAMNRVTAGLPWPLPEGYVTEYQPMLGAWIDSVSKHLTSGHLLLVDYGYMQHEYYHPQRSQGTLIGHYRHRALDDVFVWPGLTDLSVSVNFTALAEAAESCSFSVESVQTQASFLLEHGLADRLAVDEPETDADRMKRLHEFKLLTLPSEMGDRFRVMTATRVISGG